ncbi:MULTISPECIES: glycoside hydrolase family 26 protein [Halococcus]|uniref:Endoglucanase family protein n=1 Tax=Halococcus salifodinae DSM 8989 TaxID=1227456 RepID=M0MV83_9EURY|nr:MULTISPECIES: glycosyl hydrolase [Halococcus]EMA49248.1 endoglucanase family protein [Halococcus salifodinae DSM 8989]
MNRRTFLRAAGVAGILGASGCATPFDSLGGSGQNGSSNGSGSDGSNGSAGMGGSSGSNGSNDSTGTTTSPATATPEAPSTRSGAALAGVYPGGPDFASNLAPLTEWLGQPPAVALLFVDALGPTENKRRFVEGPLTNVWEAGHVPMISWQPFVPERQQTSEAIEREIAEGEYDDQLAEWASLLESWARPRGDQTRGRRFYFRPAHEMNGSWFPWSAVDSSRIESTPVPVEDTGNATGGENPTAGTPQDYVEMWRRLYDAFDETDLDETDVQWVWAVNAEQVPSYLQTERYYPGDEYVDWVGIDGFNRGGTESYSSWQSPTQLFDPMLGRLRELTDKPMALTEFASTSVVGGEGGTEPRPARKAEWIESAFTYVEENDIKMTCWFNVDKTGVDEADWAIFGGERGTGQVSASGTQYAAYEAYKRSVSRDGFLSALPDYPPLLTDDEFAGEF